MTSITPDSHLVSLRRFAGDKRRIAFFDLDRTLVAGYTMASLVFEQMRQGVLNPRQIARQSVNYLQYGRARIDFRKLIADAAADFAGVPVAEAERFATEVFEQHVESQIFREARALIAEHRRLGHAIAMVTSATQFQAQPVARKLGIERVYSTKLEVREGTLTGRVVGHPCFGRAKASAGRRAARTLGVLLADCFFYTDSMDDLPLLEAVGHPVAVNAQPALAAHAEQQGWPRVDFTSRAQPSVQGAMRTGMVCNALLAAAAAGGAAWLGTRSPRLARNRMARVVGELGSALAGLDLEVAGQDNLNLVRPAVFIFNHQSYIDALVLLQLLRHDLAAFCKRELATTPLVGSFMRAAGAIFVDRDDPAAARAPLALGVSALRNGRSVAIAPEGTRSACGEILPFKHGAFLMARKARVPIVPLVLHNSADAMPKGSLLVHPATVRVTVLPPLDVGSWDLRRMGQHVQQVEDRYRKLLAS